MHQIRIPTLVLLILVQWVACIEPFNPAIDAEAIKKYVVSGQVTDQEGYQYVSVSLMSGIEDPHYIPLNNCTITIFDDEGNSFPLEGYEDGQYRVWMSLNNLNPGTSYKINISTPVGVEIVSDLDEMPSSPDIDNIYYLKEDQLTNDPNQNLQGIQFYIDVDASYTGNSFFRWSVEETWEYHTVYPMEAYYDGDFHYFDPPDYSRNVCWSTKIIEEIFTLSINDFDQNIFKKFPLNFVDNQSSRLAYCYSLLVKQYAMNNHAFIYWDQMRLNSSAEAGLYDKQPISVVGNLKCTTNPDYEVLGLFGVTSVKSKRIFVKNVADLELEYYSYCNPPGGLDMGGWEATEPSSYPIYFFLNDQGIPRLLNWECVDCLLLGGNNVKPDYWPDI